MNINRLYTNKIVSNTLCTASKYWNKSLIQKKSFMDEPLFVFFCLKIEYVDIFINKYLW